MRAPLCIALLLVIACGTPREETPKKVEAPPPPPPSPSPKCVDAPNRLCPRDEASSDPSFAAFREQLLDAVARKDRVRLMAATDPKIRTSFGDGGEIAWTELEPILRLGGSFRGEGAERSFWAPYVYANWPEPVDAFSHVVAIRQGVVIRAKPESSAPAIATVDWEILELIPEEHFDPAAAWRHVRTADKKEGWVASADVRSPIGYRAGFSKRSGEWRMDALVAGD